MDFDIFVPILVPSCHGCTQTAHCSLFSVNEDLKIGGGFTKLIPWMPAMSTHNMLGLDLLDKLRILRIINVGTEGDVIHRNFTRDCVSF